MKSFLRVIEGEILPQGLSSGPVYSPLGTAIASQRVQPMLKRPPSAPAQPKACDRGSAPPHCKLAHCEPSQGAQNQKPAERYVLFDPPGRLKG